MGFRAVRPVPSLLGLGFLVATLRSLAQGESLKQALMISGALGACY
jgi:hypothetical protein